MSVNNRSYEIIDITEDEDYVEPSEYCYPSEDDDFKNGLNTIEEMEYSEKSSWGECLFGGSGSGNRTFSPRPIVEDPRKTYSGPGFRQNNSGFEIGSSTTTYNYQRETPKFTPFDSMERFRYGQNKNNQNQVIMDARAEVSINRQKKIVFCDLYDILIESESANYNINYENRYRMGDNYKPSGVTPRGLYDVKQKHDVWAKIAAFNPDYVFCITNQPMMSVEQREDWDLLTKYTMRSLSEYLKLPRENCKCFTKLGFDRSDIDVKPNGGLIRRALESVRKDFHYTRNDLVIIGVNSGYINQSNVDILMANNNNIDYIDVNDLLCRYY